MWSAYLQHKILSGDAKSAKEQLARAMQSLSRHKHVYVISKHALAEMDSGSVDRGRVLFEELLNSYPKRTDLWNMYIDKEVKMQNYEEARQLFDRMVGSKLNTKNVKAAFKKYLAFEVQHGDEVTQGEVKTKAREYVSNLTAAAAADV
jgi:rRNA biogenesis protein RRP5